MRSSSARSTVRTAWSQPLPWDNDVRELLSPPYGTSLSLLPPAAQEERGGAEDQQGAAGFGNRGGAYDVELPVAGVGILLRIEKLDADGIHPGERGVEDAGDRRRNAGIGVVVIDSAEQ